MKKILFLTSLLSAILITAKALEHQQLKPQATTYSAHKMEITYNPIDNACEKAKEEAIKAANEKCYQAGNTSCVLMSTDKRSSLRSMISFSTSRQIGQPDRKKYSRGHCLYFAWVKGN